ncbi:MAG: glycosyltransferase [Candidatus Bathyarchaeota archaeon]|nr:glycosyltransferase [Candidatus Bathyarchaeota archaeon]
MHEKSEYCPKISVIVPVKNGAAHIKELLDSLMQIDYDKDKLEIIVVDGNSTDNTREIVSQYPVKLLLEERPGLNAARNTGIKNSSGEIVAFTDADCIIPKNWLSRIVDDFRGFQVGCVGGNVVGYYDSFLSHYSDESFIPVMRIFRKKEALNSVKPPQKYPAGCNMALRRDALNKVGLFDEGIKYGFDEDELVERICRGGYTMVLDPEVLVKHKHRPVLMELLKQNFSYGRGLGLMLRKMGIKSAFPKWILLCIIGFLTWSLAVLALAVHALLTSSFASQIILLTMLFLPLFGPMIFYGYQTIKKRDKKYQRIILYPPIDIARALAFIFGGIYQLFKKS